MYRFDRFPKKYRSMIVKVRSRICCVEDSFAVAAKFRLHFRMTLKVIGETVCYDLPL